MTLFKVSQALFNGSAVFYAVAFFFYATQLVSDKKIIERFSTGFGLAAFLLHTAALLTRWMDAGIAHPPWTNLYESLVFFSWGVMGAHLYLEFKHRFRLTGVFATAIVFAAMGIASLHPHKEIEPLVPALQSWWLLFHVFMACIAYAFFLGSSFICVFYLIKEKIAQEWIAGVAMLVSLFFIIIALGKQFWITGDFQFYKVVQMPDATGVARDVIMSFKDAQGKKIEEFVPLPLAPYFVWPLLALYFLPALGFLHQARAARSQMKWPKLGLNAALMLHASFLLYLLYAFVQNKNLSMSSNPYRLAALVLTFGITVFAKSLFHIAHRLVERLPSLETLDRWGYEAILWGVPFMTINLVSGAVWAYYAWGRYWGWDPKEIWALITWFVYLIYLHLRMLGGWKGRRTALLSIFGFFVVVFTYLGVNLVISGLHSYATS